MSLDPPESPFLILWWLVPWALLALMVWLVVT